MTYDEVKDNKSMILQKENVSGTTLTSMPLPRRSEPSYQSMGDDQWGQLIAGCTAEKERLLF